MADDLADSWTIIGRYALCAEIAAGGMATVYFGRLLGPSGFSRTVAIKRLHPQYAKDADFASMFLDEARLAARIRHPNVVQTLDVVQLKGELFLVMDYVQGESLSRLYRQLRQQGRLVPRRIAASIMSGSLLGLHAAHEARNEHGVLLQLVHRDVSPQNVLVGTDGVPRILDFGVAKAAGRAHTTRDGAMKGKCAYMAPEQVMSQPVTRATDVFAAGVLLWELLTGRRLFAAETDASTLMKVLHAPIEPPSHVVPGIPPAWDAVVMRATQRDPAQRFATARDMAIAVEACEGVASATQVGEWVEALAAGTLASRAQLLARIEQTTMDPNAMTTQTDAFRADSSLVPAPLPSEHTRVASTVSTPSPPQPSDGAKRTRFSLAVIAVSVPLAIAIAWGIGGARRGQIVASPAPPPSAAALPAPAAPPLPSPAPADDTPSVQVTSLPTASAPAPAARPAPARPSYPRPAAAAPAPKPAPAAPSADCDPPFTLDADGHRHYKRQCLQ
jgi:serine/threonine-protein kinase